MNDLIEDTGYIICADDNGDMVIGPFTDYNEAQKTITNEKMEGCRILRMVNFVDNGKYLH